MLIIVQSLCVGDSPGSSPLQSPTSEREGQLQPIVFERIPSERGTSPAPNIPTAPFRVEAANPAQQRGVGGP